MRRVKTAGNGVSRELRGRAAPHGVINLAFRKRTINTIIARERTLLSSGHPFLPGLGFGGAVDPRARTHRSVSDDGGAAVEPRSWCRDRTEDDGGENDADDNDDDGARLEIQRRLRERQRPCSPDESHIYTGGHSYGERRFNGPCGRSTDAFGERMIS